MTGFSAQKRIKSDVRGSLHVDTVEDLIRISLEGTSLEEVDAKEAEQMRFSQGKIAKRSKYKGWCQVLVVLREICSKGRGSRCSL